MARSVTVGVPSLQKISDQSSENLTRQQMLAFDGPVHGQPDRPINDPLTDAIRKGVRSGEPVDFCANWQVSDFSFHGAAQPAISWQEGCIGRQSYGRWATEAARPGRYR